MMGGSSKGSKCSVRSCSNRRGQKGNLNFFRFPNPQDEERVLQWKKACGDDNIMEKDPSQLYSSFRICSSHFEKIFITGSRLDHKAVPTLNLFQTRVVERNPMVVCVDAEVQTDDIEKFSIEIQTDNIEITNQKTQTPKKLLHQVELNESPEVSGGNATVMRKLFEEKENIPPRQYQKEIFELQQYKPKGRRYSKKFKQQALSLYCSGARAYRQIASTYNFPSVSTLKRMTTNIQQKPGLNSFIFKSLKIVLDGKNDNERLCVLTMDEMSLKVNIEYNIKYDEIIGFHDLGYRKEYKPAKNVLVLMARGIDDTWKQPLGYFFINSTCHAEDLKHILFECISKLHDAGADVRAVISDMGSNFIQFSKKLGVTAERPYFSVDEKKIYYIFDTPHLIKAIRNMLMKYSVLFENQEAQWSHIEQLYHIESKRDVRMVTKLTEAHVYPTGFQKMRVKFATQIFSFTVAAAMDTYISIGSLDSAAVGTANMLKNFDHLFDLLNASTTKTTNQFKKPYKGKEADEEFLKKMIDSLQNMKVFSDSNTGKRDITNTFKTLKCFQITIRSVMCLWEDLKSNIDSLKTRRLNQDCLENFFGKIRQQGGHCVNPTPSQFMSAFSKLSCMDLIDCLDSFNCASDADTLLLDEPRHCNLPQTQKQSSHSLFKITNADFRKNDIPTKNVEHYVSGYLLRKCLKKHSCQICDDYSRAERNIDLTNLFSYFKGDTDKYGQREGLFGKLLMPAETFVNYISTMESIFMENINFLATQNLGESLYNKIVKVPFQHPCPNFPHDYMIKLYIRMRIFYAVKYANRGFHTQELEKRRANKNRKLQILSHK